jgi:hypothetical protein
MVLWIRVSNVPNSSLKDLLAVAGQGHRYQDVKNIYPDFGCSSINEEPMARGVAF